MQQLRLPADLSPAEREAAILDWAIRTGAYTEVAADRQATERAEREREN